MDKHEESMPIGDIGIEVLDALNTAFIFFSHIAEGEEYPKDEIEMARDDCKAALDTLSAISAPGLLIPYGCVDCTERIEAIIREPLSPCPRESMLSNSMRALQEYAILLKRSNDEADSLRAQLATERARHEEYENRMIDELMRQCKLAVDASTACRRIARWRDLLLEKLDIYKAADYSATQAIDTMNYTMMLDDLLDTAAEVLQVSDPSIRADPSWEADRKTFMDAYYDLRVGDMED